MTEKRPLLDFFDFLKNCPFDSNDFFTFIQQRNRVICVQLDQNYMGAEKHSQD